MGLYLVADILDSDLLATIWTFTRAAFALGVVIFVHELGHFAVAKWCGVKCEKFYLGFDIYGLKLAKFRYGETEYGIGILPLGGYVKMLGQDDNPARAAEERQRSQIPIGTDVAGSEMTPAQSTGYALDPRSYMAQSVPKRMAIISAGVIMNVIFALFAATVAYRMGVDEIACVIGDVVPGEAAWQADMRGGDVVTQIGDYPPRFPLRYRDLMHAVVLGDLDDGVKFTVERPGVPRPIELTVYPSPGEERARLAPTIGVVSSQTTTLHKESPVEPGSSAAIADSFQGGDRIVEVNGTKIESYRDLERLLVENVDSSLNVVVERSNENETGEGQERTTEMATVDVPASPMRTLGLVMKIGKITAVQDNSPAAAAGIRAGDFIKTINGQNVGDPMTLGDRMREGEFGERAELEIIPKDEQKSKVVEVDLRKVDWYESPRLPGNSTSVPSLGVAVRVLNVVDHATPGGPADAVTFKGTGKDATGSKIETGSQIVKAELIFPETAPADWKSGDAKLSWPPKPVEVEFSEEKPNWAHFINRLQEIPKGTKVRLTLNDGRSAEVTPTESSDWFNPSRGFVLEPLEMTSKADSLVAAMPMALRETRDSLTQVYAFLRRIGGQVSVKALGGPVTIFQQAGAAADQGFADLLIFLTMLSANLAVINFLPIPLLDGGHMVFLALEAIFRKPVSERVVVAFHYVGFVFILTLMMFVLGLDLGIISRHG